MILEEDETSDLVCLSSNLETLEITTERLSNKVDRQELEFQNFVTSCNQGISNLSKQNKTCELLPFSSFSTPPASAKKNFSLVNAVDGLGVKQKR